MKKIIAVLIALAMVLSMSVMAFAGFNNVKSPADILTDNHVSESDYESFWNNSIALGPDQLLDPDNWWQYIDIHRAIDEQNIYRGEDGNLMKWENAWSAYYSYVLANASSDTGAAVKEAVAIIQGGYIPAGDAIAKAGEAIMGGIGGDGNEGDLSGVISDIIDKITGGETEPEVTADQYADELTALINSGAAFDEITAKIGEDLANGKIVANQIPDIVKIISARVESGEIENNETVQKILEFMEGLGNGGSGIEFPDFGDITLPWDNGNSESGSFLDTILGIIGSIGDLFNPTTPDDPTPDNPSDPGDTTIPDTGDVSFVAVAAVAAVAGVALVLTRKKKDAE